MRNSIVDRVTSFARERKELFFITGDAGFGVLDEYQHEMPERFLNMGVAEQNMISFAAGMALAGHKLFLYNLVPFLLYRCYEQVKNDICYQRLPVTMIGIGAGVTYAPQGATHYSVEDIAIARTLPNLVILSPSDPLEAVSCVEYAMASNRPVYIRVAKSGEPAIHTRTDLNVDEPIVLKEGRGVAVLFHGSISIEVKAAIDDLNENPMAISLPMIQPLNFDLLYEKLVGVHTIITVEEHYVDGGLGSVIAEWLSRERLPYKLNKMGIKNEFIHLIKNNSGMRQHYKISSNDIKEAIDEAFGNG